MPEYIVSLKNGLTEEQYAAAQKEAKDQGGKISTVYDREGVAPGFVVEFAKDSVQTMEKHEHVEAVEPNGVMKTQ